MMKKATMTKKDKYLLYGMAIGLSILLILRDINGVSISKFIYFGYVVAFMMAASYETMVNMICFIIPLVCGLPGTYIMPCVLALLIIKRGKIKAMQIVPIMIILLLELFAAIWYPVTDFALIVHYVSFAAIMFFMIQDDKELDYQYCMVQYIWGSVLLCGVIIYATLMNAPDNWMDLFAEGFFRFGEGVDESAGMKLSLNANALGYYSILGMACSILLVEKQKGLKKCLFFAALVLFAIAGFFTLSRTWLAVSIGCLLLYTLNKIKNPKQFIWICVILVVLVSIVMRYLNNNPEMLAGFETRFEDGSVETAGGRAGLFARYMNVYFSKVRYMLLGTGVTQYTAAEGAYGAIHNGLQQILVCCGLVGFVLYMTVMVGPILKATRGKKHAFVCWLPLICFVAIIQTIQFLLPSMLLLPYVICVYALRVEHKEKLGSTH